MATSIVMPKMSYDMQQGTVVRWLKDEGDTISSGEVIAEIETDKATVEMPAYVNGVMGRIVVETGRSVPVGELIAVIAQVGETLPPIDTLSNGGASSAPESRQTTEAIPLPAASSLPANGPSGLANGPAGEVRASPIARRLARERGIDLTQVVGSGPGGRIVEADILAWQDAAPADSSPQPSADSPDVAPVDISVEAQPAEPPKQQSDAPVETPAEAVIVETTPPAAVAVPVEAALAPARGVAEPLSRMRQAIARVTSQSKQEVPHFYVAADIDMTRAMALRRQINESLEDGGHVTVNDMVVKAVAMVLQAHPRFNSSFRGDHLEMHQSTNIGVAIALEEGLIIAAVPGCQDRSLLQIAGASRELAGRAQGGSLRAEEYESTFSISNMGMFDVDSFSAIIYPPNAAVLAIASVKERPVARDGQLAVAQMMSATLSVDHRVADGAEAARFLVEVKALLEQPVKLLF